MNVGDVFFPLVLDCVEYALGNFEKRGDVIEASPHQDRNGGFMLVDKFMADECPCVLENCSNLNLAEQFLQLVITWPGKVRAERNHKVRPLVSHPISTKAFQLVDTLNHVEDVFNDSPDMTDVSFKEAYNADASEVGNLNERVGV